MGHQPCMKERGVKMPCHYIFLSITTFLILTPLIARTSSWLAPTAVPGTGAVPLARVRFSVEKKLFTLEDVEREARALLRKEGTSVPPDVPPEFELRDTQAFVTVKFLQGVGNAFWYVRFNRKFQVEEWGQRTQTEK